MTTTKSGECFYTNIMLYPLFSFVLFVNFVVKYEHAAKIPIKNDDEPT